MRSRNKMSQDDPSKEMRCDEVRCDAMKRDERRGQIRDARPTFDEVSCVITQGDGGGEGVGIRFNPSVRCFDIPRLEWWFTNQHGVENHTERPNINLKRVTVAF